MDKEKAIKEAMACGERAVVYLDPATETYGWARYKDYMNKSHADWRINPLWLHYDTEKGYL